jgi:hypothetical protein
VFSELSLSATTLILFPQPPVVPVSFDFLRAVGKRRGVKFVKMRGCQLNSSAANIVCNVASFQKKKFGSCPNFHFNFPLDNVINGI